MGFPWASAAGRICPPPRPSLRRVRLSYIPEERFPSYRHDPRCLTHSAVPSVYSLLVRVSRPLPALRHGLPHLRPRCQPRPAGLPMPHEGCRWPDPYQLRPRWLPPRDLPMILSHGAPIAPRTVRIGRGGYCESVLGKMGSLSVSSYSPHSMRAIHHLSLERPVSAVAGLSAGPHALLLNRRTG